MGSPITQQFNNKENHNTQLQDGGDIDVAKLN
jgi:hypothetical protein